jgi:hypothetical protein
MVPVPFHLPRPWLRTLSERTVRYKLDDLEKAGLIPKGNQAIAAVHIDRHDRRPVVYDLQLSRGANPAPRSKRGADDATGCNSQQNGVQPGTERGAAAAPNTSLNHQVTEEQLQRDLADEISDRTRPPSMRWMIANASPCSLSGSQMQIACPIRSRSRAFLPTRFQMERFRKFKGFFVAKPNTFDSGAGWCFRLVQWVKRERVKAAGKGKSLTSTTPAGR